MELSVLVSTQPGNCVEQYSFNFFSRGKLGAIVIQLELFQSKLVVCIWSLNFYYSFSKFKSMRVYIYIERERKNKLIIFEETILEQLLFGIVLQILKFISTLQILRASTLNVSNVKYLAHLAYQTSKNLIIKCSKSYNFCHI